MGLKELLHGFLSSSGEPIIAPTLPSGSPLADSVREVVETEFAAREARKQTYAETQARIASERAEAERAQREEQQKKIDTLRNELGETFSKFKIAELMRDLRNNVWRGGDLSPEPLFALAYKEHYYLPGSETGHELFARLSITYRGTIVDPSGHVPSDGGGYIIGEVNHGPGTCITGLDVGVRAFDESKSLFVRTISHPFTIWPFSILPLVRGESCHGVSLHTETLAEIPINEDGDRESVFNQLSGIVAKDATGRYLRGFLPPSRLVENGVKDIGEFERKKTEAFYRNRGDSHSWGMG